MKFPYFIVFNLLAVSFLTLPVFAQQYQVVGRLQDQSTKDPLGFVQVALFETTESTSPVAYGDSDENGKFSISAEPGRYQLKAFFIGYDNLEVRNIELTASVDLGTLEMVSEGTRLDEVIVETTKMPVRTSMEGLIISPENNIANVGGTLLDVLRNTPSISVAEDGTLSLRGSSGINVLINGRNSSLTQNLDQLPASAVEEIRIINNPNARFDAEAEGGVIDIILKKGQDLGTNGGMEMTYGTRDRTNVGGRINHRTSTLNTYASYNYRDWKGIGTRRTTRELFDRQELLNQNTQNSNRNAGHNLNYGLDYYFGNSILSYEGVYQSSEDWQTNTLFAELNRAAASDSFDYVRRNTENETDDGLDNALIFEHMLGEKGHLIRASASHSFRNQYKTQRIDIFNGTLDPATENLTGRERALTDEVRNISVFQVDYIRPTNSGKLETGLKSNIRKFDNDYQYFRFEEASQDFVNDQRISNFFTYKDQIHAAYVVYSGSHNKWEYGVGLRGELSLVDTYLRNTGDRNTQNYFNLFPSLQGMYTISDIHAIKATFSRRIDRPTAWRLNPFPDITDSLSVRRGNPNLQPEMINSFELGHMANFEGVSLTTNLFYRSVSGQLDFITIVEDGISYSQPDNLLSAESYGVEWIGTAEITPWYSINGGVTLFQIAVDGSNISQEFTNSGFSWNTKLTQDFKLPWGVRLQFVANYESPEIEAQGRDLSQYFIDGSVQRRFLKSRANLSLSVRDIFDTRRFAGNAFSRTFAQSFYSKQETRIFLVSARYNF